MATVTEITEPYGNILIPILPSGPGVCETCRSTVDNAYFSCFQCNSAHSTLGSLVADTVVPISLAVKGRQLAFELWRYKNHWDEATRDTLRPRLAAVLWRFLRQHEQCVARAAGADQFELVTTVPSTQGRSTPVQRIVSAVQPVRDRYDEMLLSANPAVAPGRSVRRDRFLVSGDRNIEGASVLLIDDTWTTGGHAQSAAAALKLAGAENVAVVVIGRHFNPDYEPGYKYLRAAQHAAFNWGQCCVH